MATIVLGAIGAGLGGVFGGPGGARLGWAVGTTVGSLVDSLSVNPPAQGKLADLKLSGSTYGASIPMAWGRVKLSGNILWVATDASGNHLVEHKSSAGGGKGGGGGATQYSYSCSFAVGVCRGTYMASDGSLHHRNIALKRVWADDKLIYDATSTDPQIITPTWYDGTETQAADPIITANLAALATPDLPTAFRGMAYMVLQDLDVTPFSNRIPNISVEIEGDAVTVADIFSDLATQSNLISSDLDVTLATKAVTGYQVNERLTVQDAVTQILTYYTTDAVEVDGVLRLVPRGGATSFTIADSDLGASMQSGGEPPVKIEEIRQQDYELPGRVDVTYYNAGLNKAYEQQTQSSVRPTLNVANSVTVSTNLSLYDDNARQYAAQFIDTAWVERSTYNFSLPPNAMTIAPADVGTIPLDGATARVRIISVEIGLPGELRFSAVLDSEDVVSQAITGDPGGGSGGGGGGTLTAIPTTFTAWSGKELRDADQANAGFYVAATSPAGWSGAVIYYSPDSGTTWVNAGVVGSKATFGVTTSVLAAGTSGTWDTTHTVGVSLVQDGALASTTDADVLAGNNSAIVGNEILGFATATLTSAQHYTLSRLQRGERSSPMSGHASGEPFILATNDLVRVSVADTLIGTTVQVKCVSRYQTLADVTAVNVVIAAKTPSALSGMVATLQSQLDYEQSPHWLIEWNDTTVAGGTAAFNPASIVPTKQALLHTETGDLNFLGGAHYNPIAWGIEGRVTTELLVSSSRTISVIVNCDHNSRLELNGTTLTPDAMTASNVPLTVSLALVAGWNTLRASFYNDADLASGISIVGASDYLGNLVDAIRAYIPVDSSAVLPVTTKGDLLIFDTVADRLAVGSDTQILTADSTQAAGVKWAAPASQVPLTTKGDLFGYSTTSIRVPVGTDAFVLTADSTQAAGIKWAAAPTYTPPVTTKGDLFTFSTVSARLPVGSNGQVLTADSTQATGIKWAASSGSLPLTTKGDLIAYSTSAIRLAVGSDGQVLTADSTQTAGVKWATPSGGGSTTWAVNNGYASAGYLTPALPAFLGFAVPTAPIFYPITPNHTTTTFYLPTSADYPIIVKKLDSSSTTLVIAAQSGQNLDGASSVSLTAINSSARFFFDGTDWYTW